MAQSEKHFYDFGPFRLDPVERLLLREGQHVQLTPKAFEMLLALVESGGHVIDKDELLKKVWPDTIVEEVNLAKNISYLRKVLGGELATQYIETIPRRGYRFVATVQDVCEARPEAGLMRQALPYPKSQTEDRSQHIDYLASSVSEQKIVKPESLSYVTRVSQLNWQVVFLALALMLGVTVWAVVFRSAEGTSPAHLKIVPFTSFLGRENQAAFSPDGNQIAFVWDGGTGGNPDLYVQLIGAGQPLRLTTHAAADTHPAWSPDGRHLAFFRQTAESSAFYLVPALGGPERKVANVFPYRVPFTGNSQYFSPEGKDLVIADKNAPGEPFSLYFVSIESGEKRQVTAPPAGTVGDAYPAFSPDGKTLAFIRSSSRATTDLYLLRLERGELPKVTPQRLTFDNTSILGFAWTADGREIVFSSRRGGSLYSLWRIPISGGPPGRLPTIGQSVISPAISRTGGHLVYTQTLDDQNIWQLELDAAGDARALRGVIHSTLEDTGPDYAPNGQKVVFASNRSGGFGIWTCDRDGANPMQLLERGPNLTGTPRWSPDGRWIAFDSRSDEEGREGNADIYVISAEGGPPRRLTIKASEDVAPSWSRDGRWIYFGSSRGGTMQIWKVPAAGGQAMQVTKQGGFEGFESPDGKFFYYAKGRTIPGIWQVPTAGGEETLLFDHHKAGYWRFWTVAPKGIYFATANDPARPSIEFFDFATRNVRQIATLDKPLSRSDPGLTLAPDGRTLLFSQLDHSGSDILLVENFH